MRIKLERFKINVSPKYIYLIRILVVSVFTLLIGQISRRYAYWIALGLLAQEYRSNLSHYIKNQFTTNLLGLGIGVMTYTTLYLLNISPPRWLLLLAILLALESCLKSRETELLLHAVVINLSVFPGNMISLESKLIQYLLLGTIRSFWLFTGALTSYLVSTIIRPANQQDSIINHLQYMHHLALDALKRMQDDLTTVYLGEIITELESTKKIFEQMLGDIQEEVKMIKLKDIGAYLESLEQLISFYHLLKLFKLQGERNQARYYLARKIEIFRDILVRQFSRVRDIEQIDIVKER